eukprot:589376_1
MAYKYITFTVDGNAHRKRFTVEALQTFDGFKQALVTKMNEEIAAEQKDAGDEEIVFVIRDLAYMLDGVEVTINIAADWDDLWADVSRQDNPMPMPRFNLNNREERRAIADRARAERERAQANAREREQLAATEAQRVQEALKREKEKRFRALCTTIQSNKLMIFDDKKDNIEYFQIQYKQYADNNHITTEETNRMLINGTILSSDAFRYLQTTVGAQQNCDYWAILIERYKKPSSIHRLRVAISELGIKNNESVRDFMNRFTQLTSDLSMEVQIQTKAGFKYEQMDEFAKSREFLKALCRAPRGVAIADKLIIAATTKHQSPEIKFSQLILIVNEIIAGEDHRRRGVGLFKDGVDKSLEMDADELWFSKSDSKSFVSMDDGDCICIYDGETLSASREGENSDICKLNDDGVDEAVVLPLDRDLDLDREFDGDRRQCNAFSV